MKRAISILLTVLLLITMFGACTSAPAETANTPPGGGNAEIQEESTDEGGEKVIRLVTDFGRIAEWRGGPSSTESAQIALNQALDYLGNLPEGYRVEAEVLPTDEAEFQSRLTRLKVEIMSGQGPDIYVMNLEDPQFMDRVHDRMFPDAHKAMTDGYFLPLDSYIENAQFMKLKDMNPVVMDAGCTSEGRYILPMRYAFSFGVIKKPVGNLEVDWFAGVDGDDPVLARAYAENSNINFHRIFQETIDYETRSLTFSEEELYHALTSAIDKGTPFGGEWDDTIYTTVAAPFYPVRDLETEESDIDNIYLFDPRTKDTDTYVPMRNREGGVTASITSYIAINRNSPYPKEAFHVVDVMMSKEFQSGIPFWKEERREDYDILPGDTIAVFSDLWGVPVYDDLMQYDQPMLYWSYIVDEMFPTYCALRDEITHVKFINVVDQTLDDLKYNAWMKSMKPGDELKKYVSQEYDKMTLLVGEM